MRDAVKPEMAGARPRVRRRTPGPLGVALSLGLLALFLGACASVSPSPSASPPTVSASVSASPTEESSPSKPADGATPASQSAPPIASSGVGSDVLIALVELAAEDPSPGGTYIVIENPGVTPADIGCWRLSTTTREDLRIPAGSTVPAGGGLRLFFDRGAVANPDRLELRDKTDRVVDATPVLHDTAGDDQLFGRVGGQWVLDRPPLPRPLVDGGFIGPAGC
jgi:hypothetical protein